jgi:hypothetical protein
LKPSLAREPLSLHCEVPVIHSTFWPVSDKHHQNSGGNEYKSFLENFDICIALQKLLTCTGSQESLLIFINTEYSSMYNVRTSNTGMYVRSFGLN